jgi:hypothetical protein
MDRSKLIKLESIEFSLNKTIKKRIALNEQNLWSTFDTETNSIWLCAELKEAWAQLDLMAKFSKSLMLKIDHLENENEKIRGMMREPKKEN